MKTFLLIYFTIGTALLIIWYIFTTHWQKKCKKILKDWIFWSNVIELVLLWPINVVLKLYLTYMVLTGKVDDGIIDDATDNYEDRE